MGILIVLHAPLLLNTSPPPQNVIQGPEEVARSHNGGATWTGLSSGGPTTGGETPPWLSIDPQTGRIWFATAIADPSSPAGYCGARISWSDDGGNHWQTNPLVGCPAGGAEKVLEGPAPAGGARPHGYAHVVYYCANQNDGMPQQPVYCYKSLDGGRTFGFTGANPDPTPPPSCTTFGHRARTGVVGPDGDLYFPTNLCGSLGVTVSTDEGASWHNMPTGITGVTDTLYVASLAVDYVGNLYFSYLGSNGLPQLIISRDHAKDLVQPDHRDGPPALTSAMRVAITAALPERDRPRLPRHQRWAEPQRLHHREPQRPEPAASLLERAGEQPGLITAGVRLQSHDFRQSHPVCHRRADTQRRGGCRISLRPDHSVPRRASRRSRQPHLVSPRGQKVKRLRPAIPTPRDA